MKKSYLIMAAIASVALASCSDEQFVGEVDPGTGQGNPTVIRFGSLGKGLTRADLTGEAAAEKLNKNFVFEGTKAVGNTTYSLVINDYQANYVTNTAHSTESNSDNWEYVGYKNVPGGVTANTGVPTFAAAQNGNDVITQSIKYWDYGTSQYDFAAYSLGEGNTTTENNTSSTTYATASTIDMTKAGSTTATDFVYSLTGSADELKACYISDLVTAYNRDGVSDYGNVVTFKFRSLATKIRIALYETVPGYSVGDVLFYADNNTETTPTTTPTLFASSAVLPSGSGTMTVTFPTVGWGNSGNASGSTKKTDYNKAHIAFTPSSTGTNLSSTLIFDALANYADAESKEVLATSPAVPTTGFLGRASNAATYAGGLDNGTGKYYTILPYETGANLTLRIKYTLVSTDGSKESITVDNATAVIPEELAKWSPNYAYTYIFKISDMTNGTTGIDHATNKPSYGLTPITLNAVVVDSEDGVQETITTVSDPSITTYTQGQVVTANDEYISGNTIYVIVNNGTENVALNETAKLYTVTQSKVDNNSAENANQPISEESVANAFAYGKKDNDNNPTTWTVTDANKWNLTLTASSLNFGNAIAAADSPTGNEITIGTNEVATFTAGNAGTIYAFQYRKVDADKTTYTAAGANTYNAGLPGAISKTDTPLYSFMSYGSATGNTPQYGSGVVKQVSQANGWTTVLVITNTADNENVHFVGKQFKVQATILTANTRYELYTDAGAPTGIYVTVSNENVSLQDSEVNAYNATLPGAVSEGTIKPDAYGYKIIKIKE